MKEKIIDRSSYKVHLIETDKFKDVHIEIRFREELKKENITKRNVVTNMLLVNTEEYNTTRKFQIAKEELYNAHLSCCLEKIGQYISSGFSIRVLGDKYSESGNVKKAIKFLTNIIYHPNAINKSFDKDNYEYIMENIKNDLKNIKDDKINYSEISSLELYDKDNPASFRIAGYLEDLNDITPKNLYEYYMHMIRTNILDIYVVGSFNEVDVLDTLKEKIKCDTLKRNKILKPYKTKKRIKALRLTEKDENTQSNLVNIYSFLRLKEKEKKYVMPIFSYILGGGVSSKLFKDVREEKSMAYFINSSFLHGYDLFKIRAGITKDNHKEVLKLIDKNVASIKKGDFTDEDIITSINNIITTKKEYLDYHNGIINYFYTRIINDIPDIEDLEENMNKVTKKEISSLAKKLKLECAYLLEGDKDGRN